jgi:hypothetical protein
MKIKTIRDTFMESIIAMRPGVDFYSLKSLQLLAVSFV